jgi:hypothetical protein
MKRSTLFAGLLAGALLAVLAPPASAQGTCNVNFRAACQVGGTAAYGMNVTIPRVVRLSLPANPIVLGAADAAAFTAGFGTAVLVPLTLRANTGWSLTLAATSPLLTGTGPAARTDKPASDLQWSVAAGGPFTGLGTVGTGIATGTATAGQTVTLYLRSLYAWTLDTPGSYSLPLVLTITAP